MFPDGAIEATESNVWSKTINSYDCDVGKYTILLSFY